jgi:hypothetical protein
VAHLLSPAFSAPAGVCISDGGRLGVDWRGRRKKARGRRRWNCRIRGANIMYHGISCWLAASGRATSNLRWRLSALGFFRLGRGRTACALLTTALPPLLPPPTSLGRARCFCGRMTRSWPFALWSSCYCVSCRAWTCAEHTIYFMSPSSAFIATVRRARERSRCGAPGGTITLWIYYTFLTNI